MKWMRNTGALLTILLVLPLLGGVAHATDTTPPDTSITGSPASLTNVAYQSNFYYSSTETSSFQCKLDAGAWTGCGGNASYSSIAYAALSDGSHTFQVKATDAAGNADPTPATYTWTIDTVPPDTIIDSGPPLEGSSTPTFTFHGTGDAVSFQCRLDSGAWQACTSPKSYSGVSLVSHTFRVAATDQAGNTDYTPATYVFGPPDLTPPETSITGGPASLTRTAYQTNFYYSSTETSSFQCKLDDGAWTGCGGNASYSSIAYAALSDGSHTFQVKATDEAGNADPTPATHTWTIDTVPPDTIIDSGPPLEGSSTPTFTFHGTGDALSFQCRLDSGTWQACTSPKSYSGVSLVSHTFRVAATDQAGNTDYSPATYVFGPPDLTPPETSITGGPANPTRTAYQTNFSYSSTEISSFQCKLDAGGWMGCGGNATYSSIAYAALSDGSHTFQVRATDEAGNADPTPATHTWTIDTVPPDTIIDSGPTAPGSASPSFTFHGTGDAVSFLCQLDGGAWQSCTSPKSYSGVATGGHTFKVAAYDQAGNTDYTPASYAWTNLDVTPPDTLINRGPDSRTTSHSAVFSFFSSESGSSFQCRLDGGPLASCSTGHILDGLGEGSHTFEVTATDGAGNVDPTPATYPWTIDTTPPDTIIDSGPPPIGGINAEFSFHSSEEDYWFQCLLDGVSWHYCLSPSRYEGLAPGSHTFQVAAHDYVDNVDPTPATYTWTVSTATTSVTLTGFSATSDLDGWPWEAASLGGLAAMLVGVAAWRRRP